MELYNSLKQEFHLLLQSKNHINKYKRVADQIGCGKAAKRILLQTRKKELEECQSVLPGTLGQSRCSVRSKISTSSFSEGKQELVRMEHGNLRRKIAEIQNQLSLLHVKTQQITQQLTIFTHKNEEIDLTGKKSEMDLFNSIQELSIFTAKEDEEQVKENKVLGQLAEQRETLADEIKQIIDKQKQKGTKMEQLKQRTKKQVKIQPNKPASQDISQSKQILTTMLKILALSHEYKIALSHEYKIALSHEYKSQCRTMKQIKVLNVADIENKIDQISTIENRCQLLLFIEENGIVENSCFGGPIVDLYHLMEGHLSRKEKENQLLNQQLASLKPRYEKLISVVQEHQKSALQEIQQELLQSQEELEILSMKLNRNCQVLAHFLYKYHFLLSKLTSHKKTAESIMNQPQPPPLLKVKSNMGGSNTSCHHMQTDRILQIQKMETIIMKFGSSVAQNVEERKVRWLDVVKNNIKFYQKFVEGNQVVRIFGTPNNYRQSIDDLQNFDLLLVGSLRQANELLKQISQEITNYFHSFPDQPQNIQGKSPSSFPSTLKLCVESDAYYRRDDFKFLQKMQKIQMKKKGLLMQIPFHIQLQNQLNFEPDCNPLTSFNTSSHDRNRRYMKYTTLASKREEVNIKSRSIRKMFNQLDSIRNSKVRHSNKDMCPSLRQTSVKFNGNVSTDQLHRRTQSKTVRHFNNAKGTAPYRKTQRRSMKQNTYQ